MWRKIWSEVSRGNEEARRQEDVLSRNSLSTDLILSRRVSDSIHCEPGLCHAKSEAVLCASHISALPFPHVFLYTASQSVATISSLNSLTLNPGQPAWAGIDLKRGLYNTRLNTVLLTNREAWKERLRGEEKFPSHQVFLKCLPCSLCLPMESSKVVVCKKQVTTL